MNVVVRPCLTCRRTFEPAAGNQRYCSDVCRCGTNAGYGSGCRCVRCRAAHARTRKHSRVFPSPLIPALGSRRRVQALGCMGWSYAKLSLALGRDRSYLFKVLSSSTLSPATAGAISDLYDRLCMTFPTPANPADRLAIEKTRKHAERNGWSHPLAWDDIDDPNEKPAKVGAHSHHRPRDWVDHVVVERILDGDSSVTASKAERTEVCRRWVESGRSLKSLEAFTGWSAVKYFRLSDVQAVA